MNNSLPMPVTQARSRAARYFNVRVLPRHATQDPPRIPTISELQLHVARVYSQIRQRSRNRQATATESTRSRSKILSSGELTDNQRDVISQMEFHVLKDVLWVNPWPERSVRQGYLLDAQQYASGLTGVIGSDVFSVELLSTVWYRMSNDRGNSLARIECMMENEFGIATSDKQMLFKLMDKDGFLFPTDKQEPSSYFCVGALGSALEIILFKSAKQIGVVFMEEFCRPDSPADWHKKLRDQTACEGISPGLLAFAATQMYWALEGLYMGTARKFEEQHYRGVWDRYFRALIKLPHLGRLRIDMLDRMKEYYVAHWPGEEPDEDEESFPAW
ncbi:hypothetical protein BDV93DRAFT_612324 [Ceratobasidium sp. AG-I]|nr:hypothetical protein BDV93DRAFT_612324 [Ceratobasidium sp. AG-I]